MTRTHIDAYEDIRRVYTRHANRAAEFQELARIQDRCERSECAAEYRTIARTHLAIADDLVPVLRELATRWFDIDVGAAGELPEMYKLQFSPDEQDIFRYNAWVSWNAKEERLILNSGVSDTAYRCDD